MMIHRPNVTARDQAHAGQNEAAAMLECHCCSRLVDALDGKTVYWVRGAWA
jgi:hypothetical protein